jgi:ribonuclease P protein component
VYKSAKSSHSKSCVIFVLKKSGIKKIGFTASKKVGNAVHRNSAKRRLRAIFSELKNDLGDGFFIFVAKDNIKNTTYEDLRSDVQKSIKRLGAFNAKKISS